MNIEMTTQEAAHYYSDRLLKNANWLDEEIDVQHDKLGEERLPQSVMDNFDMYIKAVRSDLDNLEKVIRSINSPQEG